MSYPFSVWTRLAAPPIPAKSAMDFREVHGIANPWNPALIHERILRSFFNSLDPGAHATNLPEAPHPANAAILSRTESERDMVRTRA